MSFSRQLLDMPLEIILKILSYVDFMDLMHLTESDKSLEEIVLAVKLR